MTHRKFISIIVAAAIAITGMTTAPARADADDVAKWIAGAAALAIIGAAISEKRRDDRAVKRNHNYNNFDFGNQRHHKKKKYHNQGRHNRLALPARCRTAIHSHYGNVSGYGRRCLLNNYSRFNTLPHDCVINGWNRAGKARTIYYRECVRQYGYYTAGER